MTKVGEVSHQVESVSRKGTGFIIGHRERVHFHNDGWVSAGPSKNSFSKDESYTELYQISEPLGCQCFD